MLRKPKRWRTPEAKDTSRPREAQRAVRDAVHRLGDALARQSRVDELSGFLSEVERENKLVPKLRSVLGAHRE